MMVDAYHVRLFFACCCFPYSFVYLVECDIFLRLECDVRYIALSGMQLKNWPASCSGSRTPSTLSLSRSWAQCQGVRALWKKDQAASPRTLNTERCLPPTNRIACVFQLATWHVGTVFPPMLTNGNCRSHNFRRKMAISLYDGLSKAALSNIGFRVRASETCMFFYIIWYLYLYIWSIYCYIYKHYAMTYVNRQTFLRSRSRWPGFTSISAYRAECFSPIIIAVWGRSWAVRKTDDSPRTLGVRSVVPIDVRFPSWI